MDFDGEGPRNQFGATSIFRRFLCDIASSMKHMRFGDVRVLLLFLWCAMVSCELIECEVHVRRHTLHVAPNWPSCNVSRSYPAVWCPGNGPLPSECTTMFLWPGPNCSCLRCKHVACESRFCVRCTSQNVKKRSVDARATRFTKSAKWHDCDKGALLRWHLYMAKKPPLMWWYTASRRGHHMLDFEAGRAQRRRRKSRAWAGSDGSSTKHHAALFLQQMLGENGTEMGPWCDMDQTRRPTLPQKHHPAAQCAWNQARNPIERHAESVVFQESEQRGNS